jgi:hypothetical protein
MDHKVNFIINFHKLYQIQKELFKDLQRSELENDRVRKKIKNK